MAQDDDTAVTDTADETVVQDSPTDETNEDFSTEEVSDEVEDDSEVEESSGVEPEESGEDRNWKALREENKKLKEQAQAQTRREGRADLTRSVLAPQDQSALQLDEFKAKLMFPELDPDSDKYNALFDKAVTGEYTIALNDYVYSGTSQLPSATVIAKQMKSEWEAQFGTATAKAKVEGAKAAKKSTVAREATVEAEGRSDRGKTQQSNDDIRRLREISRTSGQNSMDAITERLSRSGL